MGTVTTNPTQSLSFWENIAQVGATMVNDDTSLGKAGKAAKWNGIAAIIILILTAILANPALFTALHWSAVIWIANILLVFLRNVFDNNVPNFTVPTTQQA